MTSQKYVKISVFSTFRVVTKTLLYYSKGPELNWIVSIFVFHFRIKFFKAFILPSEKKGKFSIFKLENDLKKICFFKSKI